MNPESLEQVAAELCRQPEIIIQQLDGVQVEMDGLRDEINLLRRRDETLNFICIGWTKSCVLPRGCSRIFCPRCCRRWEPQLSYALPPRRLCERRSI